MGFGFNVGGLVNDLSTGLSDGVDTLTGKKGLDTAAQGARDAQRQAQELAALQWQRQMQGLGEARGQTQPYLSLYDRIYGTQMAGHQAPVGGMGGGGVGPNGPGAPASLTTGYGPGATSRPGDLLGPDGTRRTAGAYAPRFGGAVPSNPAPITRGVATGAYTGQPMPQQAPQQLSPLQASLRPPEQQNGLEQLLARLRGGMG